MDDRPEKRDINKQDILDSPTDHDRLEYSRRLEFEDPDDEHLAPLELIEFCEAINLALPSIDIWLLAANSLEANYHFSTSQALL